MVDHPLLVTFVLFHESYLSKHDPCVILTLTIKHRDGRLQRSRPSDQLEVVDVTHKKMLTDIAEVVNVRRRAQQQLCQSHKMAGNVRREGWKTLQGTLLFVPETITTHHCNGIHVYIVLRHPV